jgi:hypothetical protein
MLVLIQPTKLQDIVSHIIEIYQRRWENLKPRTLCCYSYVTRSEVDLRLTDFLVTCAIFSVSNDSVTYADMRRLHVIKKF